MILQCVVSAMIGLVASFEINRERNLRKKSSVFKDPGRLIGTRHVQGL